MKTRSDEAASLLGEIVSDIVSRKFELLAVLRKAYHACVLVGWSDSQRWFQRELEGYPQGAELPWYRQGIQGETVWAAASIYDIPGHVADRTVYGEHEAPQPARMDCYDAMPQVLQWAKAGLNIASGERRERAGARHGYQEQETTIYSPAAFQQIVQAVENEAFKFASAGSTTLTYGDALETVWEAYRAQAEPVLAGLGLDAHFESIRDGIQSNNEQDWRNAMWACRDALHDLAVHLWRDPRPIYEGMKVKGKPLQVDEGHYVNRLIAYLHAKGRTGRAGDFLRAELERITSSIHTLNDLHCRAHAPVSREDARLAAMGTYLILGEFVQRTDMHPVVDWGQAEHP